MPDDGSNSDDRVQVACRISIEKREWLESEMTYGDTLQDWLEDAIDRKMLEQKGEGRTVTIDGEEVDAVKEIRRLRDALEKLIDESAEAEEGNQRTPPIAAN